MGTATCQPHSHGAPWSRAGAGNEDGGPEEAFPCKSEPFPSPVSITQPSTESRSHPSRILEPLQAPYHGLVESLPQKVRSIFNFATKILCGCMHMLSRPVPLRKGKVNCKYCPQNCAYSVAHQFSAQLFAQSHPRRSHLKRCPSCSVFMGRMNSSSQPQQQQRF